MKVLALDVSTKTGWAFFQDAQLVAFGSLKSDDKWKTHRILPFWVC